ncbi:DUF885 domain-containing protein [Pacificimonas sp. WHA3]|uniref:DUF885 domain-containing protein n=1 Tax=Pacificimonas pallii TaxID=2827236 RepID=A0ABS6SHU1_9SPHN|nr:DUF885 domain-containing protein [Pacificimonas pallii]MBV7257486.1 DUF885 domain-containing protein [Pacificimonas pallii]
MKLPGNILMIGITMTASLAAVPAAAEDQELYALLGTIYENDIAESPMLSASLGLDRDSDRWDDMSGDALDRKAERTRRELAALRAQFDPERLSPRALLHYRVLEDELQLRLERDRWRYHHYPLNQIVGLHLSIPGTLTKQHPVADKVDAEAYIARLEAVGPLLGDFVQHMEARTSRGLYGPRTVYPRLLEGARALVTGAPFDADGDNLIWADFREKVAALDVTEDERDALLHRASAALKASFRPGYERLIAQLEREQRASPVDGGVWQLADGDEYYAFLVRQFTTTDLTPAEIHELGLREVKRIHTEMDAIRTQVGFDGDLQAFFAHLQTDPRYYLPDTEEGRLAYLATARADLARMKANITRAFYAAPPIDLEVRRFEPYREKSSAGALYEEGTADGSRPGRVFLKLDDMGGMALHDREALIYHEGLPGHHMQISTILADSEMPELRKLSLWYSNSAYVEGWALYAEALAKELGGYQSPYSDFGRLSAELWRATRLVVDSGLHYKRWTPEQAIAYLEANTPSAREANIRAVDRYLAVPGQATSFKVGMIRIQEKREDARARLGDRFDIRGYHQAVLENGYVPLWAMEGWVDHWVEQQLDGSEAQ